MTSHVRVKETEEEDGRRRRQRVQEEMEIAVLYFIHSRVFSLPPGDRDEVRTSLAQHLNV